MPDFLFAFSNRQKVPISISVYASKKGMYRNPEEELQRLHGHIGERWMALELTF